MSPVTLPFIKPAPSQPYQGTNNTTSADSQINKQSARCPLSLPSFFLPSPTRYPKSPFHGPFSGSSKGFLILFL